MKTKEEIEDEIKSEARKRDKLIIEIDKSQKLLLKLAEKLYELDDKYVQINCPTCGGIGYIKDENDKKKICSNPMIPTLSCEGKGYIWMKKYDKSIGNLL